MSSAESMTVAGIHVDVVRKDIKNMHLSVYPPEGHVRVSAPSTMDDDIIRRAIAERLPWIKDNRRQLAEAPRQTKREMLSGESHYVWGKRYKLDVSKHAGNNAVKISGNTLWIISSPISTPSDRLAILDRWYHREVKKALPSLIDKWSSQIGVTPHRVIVRKMRTKWGSCSLPSGNITINSELAKKNPGCLELIVVHELVHLVERTHNQRFSALMDKHLPAWRSRQAELNDAPLSHEEWPKGYLP